MNVSEYEEILDKLWSKEEFEKEVEDQSDVKELTAEEIVSNVKLMTTWTEIFDSGTTTHITLYRNNFFDFQSITSKVLQAANKQGFSAVRRGELILDLPNGTAFSKLYLSEVLYCPEARYILVLIGQLDDAGFFNYVCKQKVHYL